MRRTPLSSVRIFVESTPSLTNLLRHCGLGFVLVLGACQKQEPEQSADKKMPLANTEPDESKRQFEADVEKSKQNAVSRFPELGVAGSEMNKAFVARVTHLRALNSPEFNYPTWPYQLACQVDYEVKQEKEKTQKEKSSSLNQKERLEKEAKQEARFGKTNHRDFTVEELLQEKTIPNVEITLIGHVTKLETSVGNNGVLFIDQKIRCDYEVPMSKLSQGRTELVTRDGGIFMISRDPKTAKIISETALFKVGQLVRLTGLLHRKSDGKLVFKLSQSYLGFGS